MNEVASTPGRKKDSRADERKIRAAFGLLGTGMRRPLGTASLQDSLSDLDEFIAVLSRLGPVFCHFGRYLGTRPDCIRPEHCLRLLETGLIAPLPAEELRAHLGHRVQDPVPPWILNWRADESRSDHLIHVYRWNGPPEVFFHLVNPRFAEAWPTDRALLRFAGPAAARLWPAISFERILEQFERNVERSLNFERTRQFWDRAELQQQRDSVNQPRLVLAPIADEFCCPGILALRVPPSATFRDLFPESAATIGPREANAEQRETARRVSLAWLHHALKFSWFPETPGVSSLALTEDNQVAFVGLSIAGLQEETQTAIFQYLTAVSSSRTDEATATLLSLLHPGKNAADFETVRDRFRQVVPFRDGGWGRIGGHELLAEHVFLQWRIATEAGYEAPKEFISFVRGFWEVALMSHRLAPEDDVLREAVNEIQLFDAFDKLRSLFTVNTLAMQGQDWLRFMMEAPEQLNAIAARKRLDRPIGRTPAKNSRSTNRWAPAAAHVFVMVSIGILLIKVAETGTPSIWLRIIGLAAFAAVAYSFLVLFRESP